MSVRLLGRAFYAPLPASLKLTLLALCDEANDDGRGVFIGQERLAEKVGVSVRTVRGTLAQLRGRGYIERTQRGSGPGRGAKGEAGRADHYQVATELLPERPANVSGLRKDRQPDVKTPATPGENTGSQLPPTRKSTHERPVSPPPYSPPPFDRYWAEYPLKIGKRAARAAFERALKRAPADEIIAGAQRYRDDPNREDPFTAHPTTWLNRDGWEDEPLPGRRPMGVLDRIGYELLEEARNGDNREGEGLGDEAVLGLPRPADSGGQRGRSR